MANSYDHLLSIPAPSTPRYVIRVGDKIVCYSNNKEDASKVSQCIYQMRGFFADDFSEPSVNVETERD